MNLNCQIVDTHAHICDPVFDDDRTEVIERAQKEGICAIIAVGETLLDAEKNLDLARTFPLVKPAAGLYPNHLDMSEATKLEAFIRRERKNLFALGEIGLDYWVVKDEPERQLQRDIFCRFIHLAIEFELPVNVHSRSAGRHAIDILLEKGARKVQLHAFDGKAATALPAAEAGYFFSIPPSVVRSRQKQKLVKRLPLSSLLVETDSPVLGPSQGERNEPANIALCIDAISELKNESRQKVIETVFSNARRLYGDLGL